MSDLMLDVDQASELKAAFRRGDWTNQEVKKLSEGTFLAEVRKVLRGQAVISVPEHLIDCDVDPFLPDGWKVEEHQKGGALKWDPAKVAFHLSSKQKGDKYIQGHKLREELKGKPVYNANLLDYLIKHPHLIPEDWKKDEHGNTRYIFFWGTIYRYRDGYLCVRSLYWGSGRWDWGHNWLDSAWDSNGPAAVPASST